MRRRIITASMATAFLWSAVGSAQATPMGTALPPAPGPRLVSAKIYLSDSRVLFWELPLALIIRESVTQETVSPLAAGHPGAALSVKSPFPSPVSLTLGKTDVTVALEAVGDPRDLQRERR